jgi:lipopolysaccharide export system permease protein
MGLIHRMILAELVKVFLVALIAITVLFVVTDLIHQAVSRGLSPAHVITAIPLLIPNVFPVAIPASTLLATCLVYSRMSDDNEILVLRSAGMNIYWLLWPAVVFGLTTSLATGALYYQPIPRSRVMMREHFLADAEGVIYRLLERDGGLKRADTDVHLYVREVQGREMLDVVVKKLKKDQSGYDQVIWAKTAKLRIEYRPNASPRDPNLHVLPAGTEASGEPGQKTVSGRTVLSTGKSSGGFELILRLYRCSVISSDSATSTEIDYLEFAIPLPDSIFGRASRWQASTHTWEELSTHRMEVKQERAERLREVEAMEAESRLRTGTEARVLREEALFIREVDIRHLSKLQRNIESEMHMRPAISLSCLCFALIGCPVAIRARRKDLLGVFVFCLLPTAFVYYPTLIFAMRMSNSGRLPPTVLWCPNILIFLASVVLIKWMIKR